MKCSVTPKLHLINKKLTSQCMGITEIMAWDKNFIFCVMDLVLQLRVKNPNSWMRALTCFLKLPNFCGKWYSGIRTCLTKPLPCFVNGRAIQTWVCTNGTRLEVSLLGIGSYRINSFNNHLDFQMYLDRDSFCSGNAFPLSITFCFPAVQC